MTHVSRRELLTGAALMLGGATFSSSAAAGVQSRVVKGGRLKQSVSRWPFRSIAMPEFCRACADMGLTAIDLLEEPEWGVVRQYGLVCSMGYAGGGSIPDGLNVRANHAAIIGNFEKLIPRAAAEKVPNVITFFGNRRGMSDEEGIATSVDGLNRVKKIAEDHGVTICIELLNSKIDHKDYHGDRTAYGAAIVKAVASPRVKLLYDIYHMQIMEGDVIRTIRDNRELIAHFHTGGVPGRNEIDEGQELNYRSVAKAIVETGFTGYLAHEFRPTRDPLASLREAIAICDV